MKARPWEEEEEEEGRRMELTNSTRRRGRAVWRGSERFSSCLYSQS